MSKLKRLKTKKTYSEILMNKIEAWRLMKNPWITIPNPSGATNKKFIKVKANDIWGDPRKPKYMIGFREDSDAA